ncbi:glycosyltransferase family 4 protein [Aneurinibacillus uraniidurans]|uniref:glycosyltransferase family 4 protein n=1 Tax=Aneurinibacillus uraniidurans TaxID=2966586 RepID=UPI00234B386D|nr:glycosyltransferase family 4 protein [Aneurinibacillus sp. B1]WCN38154.1 glycosyltransferase family 4 protein [Aneurinibacillus sp. B1]
MRIAIGVTFGLEIEKRMESVLGLFEEDGFTVEVFPIESNNINITSLPLIVNLIKEKYGTNLEEVIVVSNVEELIFSWYRCYNYIVDHFVYIPSAYTYKGEYNEEVRGIIDVLISFIGAESENLQGRIYIDLSPDTYNLVVGKFLGNYSFSYFELLNEFKNRNKLVKKISHKKYLYKELEFSLEDISDGSSSIVKLTPENIDIQKLLKQLELCPNFIPYVVFDLFYSRSFIPKAEQLFLYIMRNIRKAKQELINEACEVIISIMKLSTFSFSEQLYIISLLVEMQPKYPGIIKMFISLLLEDQRHIRYHHNVLVQTGGYIAYAGALKYDGYEADKRKILESIGDYLIDNYEIQMNIPQERNKNIVILTDQLLSLLHSPTKITLEYAIFIKKLYPDYRIVIFAEDNYIDIGVKESIVGGYGAVSSYRCREEHAAFLEGTDIEIVYANDNEEFLIRGKKNIEKIQILNPHFIFTNAEISIVQQVLFKMYPVVYLSFGSVVPGGPADVYMFKDKREAVALNEKLNTIPEKQIQQYTCAFNMPDSQKIIRREDYGFLESDFVLVTVGNRLNGEMDEGFINMVFNFLRQHSDAKWLIVGPQKIPYIHEVWKEDEKQVVFVDYEKDLVALYGICDAFLNPIRHGGGYSVVAAMAAGLPIIISSMPSDGLVFVGEKHGCGLEYEDFYQEMEKLYQNKMYRKQKGEMMKERLSKFSYEQLEKEFRQYFIMAEEEYQKRVVLLT